MSDGSPETSEEPKTGWTQEQEAIFAALEAGETVVSAAAKGGLMQTTYYDHRHRDPEFAERCDQARAKGDMKRAEELEAVLHIGAGKASEDPRFTTQLIFALKNMNPKRWRDSHEISGPGGGAIPINLVQFSSLDNSEKSDSGDSAAGE